MTDEVNVEQAPLTELKKAQRRVLGVLLEKAFTTPEYYPLTLKAVAAGCNQKSNRSPVANYSEDNVLETLDELREIGLVGEVHTNSGRSARYRHYMRQRFSLSEPQLAILTELLLRGRQQLGELRSRASRMVPIDGQEQLRTELNGLIDGNYIQSAGSLERRGIEVDHNWYRSNEEKDLSTIEPARPMPANIEQRAGKEEVGTTAPPGRSASDSLQPQLDELKGENQQLRGELEQLKQEVTVLQTTVNDLRDALGG